MPTCECGQYYPPGMPHSCKGGPAYTQPGMNELDRSVLSDVDVRVLSILADIRNALIKQGEHDAYFIHLKNKILSMDQKIDNIEAALDLLNEKIP
jgi:hypothetical protein